MIQKVLERGIHPTQNFKTCFGILSLDKRFGGSRLDGACGRSLQHGAHTYKSILNVLEAGLDLEPIEAQVYMEIPEHRNIRGNLYYQQMKVITQEVNHE